MTNFSVAENAFVNAIVTSMNTQAETIAIHEKLERELQSVATANEAVLRDLGFTDATPMEDIMGAQERYLEEAISRSALGADSPVVQALRGQLQQMRDAYEDFQRQEADKLGVIRGPEL